MKTQIVKKIREFEKINGITILFAVESGSREWGFASEDSDFDIRCVHVRKKEDYLSLKDFSEQVDSIDGNMDIVSWDLRKFFNLFLNSNPTISEWLSSEQVYIDDGFSDYFKKDLLEIFKKGFSREKLKKHYLSLARQNYEKYINKADRSVSLKKYVYILRALGCVEYLNKTSKLPPLNWRKSAVYLPKEIISKFEKFVELKRTSEKNEGSRDEQVDKFIERKLKEEISKDNENFDFQEINTLVINTILKN